MMKQLVALSLALAFALAPAAQADGVDSISIDDIIISGCGEQEVVFTGSATYSESTQHLVVELDGVGLVHDHQEPADWSTGPVTVSEGDHTLTATVYDKSDHVVVRASDSKNFSTACEGEGDEGSSEGSDNGGEGDCCPGPDPEDSASAVKAAVKGAVKAGLPESLKPLNSIFRLVFGRSPTFAEWKYWADRLLGDKPQYDALLGAMQWHQLQGRTIGDPVK
jgi:hypothetical protein